MNKRAAIYLRVSTKEQTTDNQRLALVEVAEHAGWQVVEVYEDHGISGAKGRDKRPQLDAMLKDATRRKFDVVMAWSVDRLGRSLQDLVGSLADLRSSNVDLFLHQQALDTTTPAGKAMFGMLSVFAEFERSMIVERVNAGLARARKTGTKTGRAFGRPTLKPATVDRIRRSLNEGLSIRKTAEATGVSPATVMKFRP
ncbi:DNA invertase Pin-like site-specific DNA recombinase [Rhodoligotrophos appendicifer]|uniref:recombinase family protein n=1 Tax=Rhodoligotrophos appendicifer TaxID=987056 RepID=UPI001185B211|nr:recombinase family protein [Rhodoligotrophos appendicifer]